MSQNDLLNNDQLLTQAESSNKDRPTQPSWRKDKSDILREANERLTPLTRRAFGKHLLGLGSLTLLTGCELTDDASVQVLLTAMSRLNDRAQAALFSPTQLAPTYSKSQIKHPFPFNAYYGLDAVRHVSEQGFKLAVSGLVNDKRSWTLEQLKLLPQTSQITRHICVEGWSAIGEWGGVPFATFLQRIGADTTAHYVGFRCADDYYTSIDMPTALHPQTLLALTFEEKTLPAMYGFPMKIRIPTKLGYKNPKHMVEIIVSNAYLGGYWEDQGYNWFGGS